MSEEELSRAERNEVFTASDAARAGHQVRNVMKDDFNFEVPVESVPLPSMGVVYSSDSPLFRRELVDIRAMTAREEDILTSRALIKKGTVITHLLKSCMTDKRVDPDEMLSGDRNAIMTAVRITGYGADYNVEVECPACSEKSKQTFDLATLPIKRLTVTPVAEGANLFDFTLPVSKKLLCPQLSPKKRFNKPINLKKIATAIGSGTTPDKLPLLFSCSPDHS
jgi:hypothetical protein